MATTMINALDNTHLTISKCETENGNTAYCWTNPSTHIEESIVQLYFQSVLKSDKNYKDLGDRFYKLIYNNYEDNYYKYLLKLILHTRDVCEGKGMYQLTYVFLGEFLKYISITNNAKHYDDFIKVLSCMVNDFELNGVKYQAYGSWKDMKYLLTYFRNNNIGKNTHYENIINKIIVPQMVKDCGIMINNGGSISLCGKWLPRESSKKFGWLGKKIAVLYYNTVVGRINVGRINKTSVIFKYYREVISSLNSHLDTTQIHMAAKQWDKIQFNRVTAQTMLKSKNAFMNKNNIDEEHRHICKENLVNYIHDKCKQNEPLKGQNIMPHQLVKSVLYGRNSKPELDIIELQWKGMMEQLQQNENNFMKNCIPCIDVSPSMYNSGTDPLLSAIGMGIACSEVSNIKRAFTFSEIPEYIYISQDNSFIEKVCTIRSAKWGATTNIFSMFEQMAKVCKENNVSNDEISKYSLIIFSDMQFNSCCRTPEEDLFSRIQSMFQEYGYSNIPFLIFWNLRSTNNFPTIHNTPNCLKLSGNSVSLLKMFMNTDIETIKSMSNWNIIKMVLDKERYNIFER
jgi:hypothetical protein